jgi:hypothetical protein
MELSGGGFVGHDQGVGSVDLLSAAPGHRDNCLDFPRDRGHEGFLCDSRVHSRKVSGFASKRHDKKKDLRKCHIEKNVTRELGLLQGTQTPRASFL